MLLVGMVYSNDSICREPGVVQIFRDRVRIKQLESAGVIVYTMDDKHGKEEFPRT